MWVLSSYFSQHLDIYTIGVWLRKDKKTNTMRLDSLFKKIIKYSILNSEHNWEDQCIYLSNIYS